MWPCCSHTCIFNIKPVWHLSTLSQVAQKAFPLSPSCPVSVSGCGLNLIPCSLSTSLSFFLNDCLIQTCIACNLYHMDYVVRSCWCSKEYLYAGYNSLLFLNSWHWRLWCWWSWGELCVRVPYCPKASWEIREENFRDSQDTFVSWSFCHLH